MCLCLVVTFFFSFLCKKKVLFNSVLVTEDHGASNCLVGDGGGNFWPHYNVANSTSVGTHTKGRNHKAREEGSQAALRDRLAFLGQPLYQELVRVPKVP